MLQQGMRVSAFSVPCSKEPPNACEGVECLLAIAMPRERESRATPAAHCCCVALPHDMLSACAPAVLPVGWTSVAACCIRVPMGVSVCAYPPVVVCRQAVGEVGR
jgi:hypothetical protein